MNLFPSSPHSLKWLKSLSIQPKVLFVPSVKFELVRFKFRPMKNVQVVGRQRRGWVGVTGSKIFSPVSTLFIWWGSVSSKILPSFSHMLEHWVGVTVLQAFVTWKYTFPFHQVEVNAKPLLVFGNLLLTSIVRPPLSTVGQKTAGKVQVQESKK